jgi:TonB family protein
LHIPPLKLLTMKSQMILSATLLAAISVSGIKYPERPASVKLSNSVAHEIEAGNSTLPGSNTSWTNCVFPEPFLFPPDTAPDPGPGSPENPPVICFFDPLPYFPGGEEARMKYLKENAYYPETAINAGIEGTVYARFVITESGRPEKVEILRGICDACDSMVVWLVSNMPYWEWDAELSQRKPVRFCMPVKFTLDDLCTNDDKEEPVPEQTALNDTASYPDTKPAGLDTTPQNSGLRTVTDLPAPGIRIYPNPAADHFVVQTGNQARQYLLSIFDLGGKLLISVYVTDQGRVDVSSLNNGTYILSLTNNEGQRTELKLVVLR